MKVADALRDITRLFLDTAPVVYYVEKNPQYSASTALIFDRIDNGLLIAITSPVTLAECLVVPYRSGLTQLQQDFFDLIVFGRNTIFMPIDHEVGRRAATLRAQYSLTLLDALQIAAALSAGCEALLTNDVRLQRVTELRVIVLAELEADS